MGGILGNARILIATLISAGLVLGSYALARSVEHPPIAKASAESDLLQSIASKDSDGDGLPDWEEALYGTDPHLTDSFHLNMSDAEAVSRGLIVPKAIAEVPSTATSSALVAADGLPRPADDSMTAAFAKNFLSIYLSTKQANGGADLSQAEITDIANQTLASLSAAIMTAPDFKSKDDLSVVASNSDSLKSFAASAEAVLAANSTSATTSELVYLQAAVAEDDTEAVSRLALIAKGYRNAAIGLAALPVPDKLADDDLTLINSLMRISEIVNDFARIESDPLASMLALGQHPQAIFSLSVALLHISQIYSAAGITLSPGTPGASLVNLIPDLAKQGRSPKP